MLYFVVLAGLSALALVPGYFVGRMVVGRKTPSPFVAFLYGLAGVAVWFTFSLTAWFYGQTDLPAWELAERFSLTGKWWVFGFVSLFFIGFSSGREVVRHERRHRVLSVCAVLLALLVTTWRTMPIYVFLSDDRHNDGHGYLLQTLPYTCAPVSLLNLIEHTSGSMGTGERGIARLSRTTSEGTTVSGLLRAAKALQAGVECRSLSDEELERAGPAVVMIRPSLGVRHATLLLHFDSEEAVVADPAWGVTRIAREEFLRRRYGKVLLVSSSS